MNLLSREDKLLYDSCKTFAENYVKIKLAINLPITNYRKSPFPFEDFMCFGDGNIHELCNRCPLYITEENYKDLMKTHNSQD